MAEETTYTVDGSGRHYPSWDEMVSNEANGYVAVAVLSDGKRTWPYTVGPFPTKREADNARARLRSKFKRERRSGATTASFFVRPAWKAV